MNVASHINCETKKPNEARLIWFFCFISTFNNEPHNVLAVKSYLSPWDQKTGDGIW